MSGKRKMIAYLVQLLAASVLLLTKAMSGQEYVDLQRVAIGAFILGNIVEHWPTKDAGK